MKRCFSLFLVFFLVWGGLSLLRAEDFNPLKDLCFWLKHRYLSLEQKNLKLMIKKEGLEGARFFFGDLDRWLTFDMREYLHDWRVKVRVVSLKYRDLKHRPDEVAEKILRLYEKKLAQGQNIVPKVVVDEHSGKTVYRYFIPIYTKKECLSCHGNSDQIPSFYQSEIQLLYPEDRAQGLKPGDLQGALSLEIPSEAIKYFSFRR